MRRPTGKVEYRFTLSSQGMKSSTVRQVETSVIAYRFQSVTSSLILGAENQEIIAVSKLLTFAFLAGPVILTMFGIDMDRPSKAQREQATFGY